MTKKIVSVSLFVFFAVVVAVLVAGLVLNDRQNYSGENGNQPAVNQGAVITLTVEEVSRHSNASDCWVIINNEVYDVTEAIAGHTGGSEAISAACGTEATEVFNTKGDKNKPHSMSAKEIMENYLLGGLNQKINQ